MNLKSFEKKKKKEKKLSTNEKTHYEVAKKKKKNCNTCNWQGVIIQNIQTAHATQYLKNKQPKQKMGRGPS